MALNDWGFIISQYESEYPKTHYADHASAMLRLVPLIQNELSGSYTEFGTSHGALFLINQNTKSEVYVHFAEGLYHVHTDNDSHIEPCDFENVIAVIRQFLAANNTD